jgi:glycosyltransferase involved in cell wall biosynthesis
LTENKQKIQQLESKLDESQKQVLLLATENKQKIQQLESLLDESQKQVLAFASDPSHLKLHEIINSRAWKTVILLRRFRYLLLPVNSVQERFAKYLFNRSKFIIGKINVSKLIVRKAVKFYNNYGMISAIKESKKRLKNNKTNTEIYASLLKNFPEKFSSLSESNQNSKFILEKLNISAASALEKIINRLDIPCEPAKILSAIRKYFGKDRYFRFIEKLFFFEQLILNVTEKQIFPLVEASKLPEEISYKRRRRILFITSMFPSSYHGGGNRVLNFIKNLSESNEIYLCSSFILNEDESALKEIEPYCRSVYMIPHWQFGGNHEEIHRWLDGKEIDVVHYEWPQSLENYDKAFGRYHIFTYMEAVSLRLIIDLKLLNPLSVDWIDKFVMLVSSLCIELADTTPLDARIAVTMKDGEFFKGIFPYQEYSVLNHGLSFDEFTLDDVEPEPNTLVFVGNYKHYPNADAMEYFFKYIWDDILKEIPDVKIYLVGINPTEHMKSLADNKRIIVTGKVFDVRPYIQKAMVCIAPLITGAGLRGKVIEYAALRRCFVATSIATTDLVFRDGIDYLCADNEKDFSKNVVKLLKNDSLRKKMSQNVFKSARESYDTQHLTGFLTRLYNRMEKVSIVKN